MRTDKKGLFSLALEISRAEIALIQLPFFQPWTWFTSQFNQINASFVFSIKKKTSSFYAQNIPADYNKH